ncbi:Ni,Fe-hydrogenase III large subunit [Dehalogenimonas alkenigignens]|uniref:Ni,Fe-hydrogenase III large subunit n=1 Tax=Dehalogenimonas alkenigignens TaxID=1217799 RepID=A0A0W0GHJ1_9CHLR|nr:NADH-quinone oxidoreductase subunit C [Dehalogenimonas alkenigignens]KTB48013.1 Ni,Fe-hydrogenase III large subunit [Dehalogenimonas alkenigignens]
MAELMTIIESHLVAKGFDGRSRAGADGTEYLSISVVALVEAAEELKRQPGVVLIGLWAAEAFGAPGFTLFYAFEQRGAPAFFILEVRLPGNRGMSIAGEFPAASYYEREVSDGFGIEFDGAFDRRRLFLHEVYPDGCHPLRKSFDGGKVLPARITPEREYAFREFGGEGIYQIPVGPVHAGIIEPGHFRFSVIGETIFNLETRHFWKHRGLEKLAEGRTADAVVQLAETVSGDESAANACGLAMAIERVAGTVVPRRAWELRTAALELERIYSHLGDLAGMVVDVAYPAGAAPFFILREEILRWNAELTGSRFLKGFIVPGGVSRDIPIDFLEDLHEYTECFLARFDAALDDIYNSAWVIDRLETTGIVKPELVSPLNLTGPVARASGARVDNRIDHPYGLYQELKPEIQTDEAGDVLGRFQVKAGEIEESLRLIRDAVNLEETGPVRAECRPGSGYAAAAVEAARGQNLHWVYFKNGRVDRWKARTASFSNWLAMEHAVIGNIVPDFPLINKSMNLSYAGNDL